MKENPGKLEMPPIAHSRKQATDTAATKRSTNPPFVPTTVHHLTKRAPSQTQPVAIALTAINTRLTNDRITAIKIKRDKKFSMIVSHTWDPILRQHGDPPTTGSITMRF
jgi:hypothetical protein